jgi:hypothetical protein
MKSIPGASLIQYHTTVGLGSVSFIQEGAFELLLIMEPNSPPVSPSDVVSKELPLDNQGIRWLRLALPYFQEPNLATSNILTWELSFLVKLQ